MFATDDKFVFLVLFIAVGMLLVLISIPLILRRIPPNRWYCFRTPSTLSDTEIWYPVNALTGQRLAAAGVTIAAGAIGFYFVPRWETMHYAVAVMMVMLMSLIYAIAESARFLQQVKRERKEKLAAPSADEPEGAEENS